MDKGKRGRGGGVTRGGLFRLIVSDRPPRPPLTMPDRGPSADQPPTIGGRPPPPAPRAREPAAAPAPAAFRHVAQGRHGLLLHLPPKKAVTVALIAYYGNSWLYLQQVFALSETRPAAPADQLTTVPAGWGVVYRPGHRIGAEFLHNSSPSFHVLTPVSFFLRYRGVV